MKTEDFRRRHTFIRCMAIAALLMFGCGGSGGGDDDTFTISGTVTLSGAAYQGVTITLTGDAARAASTDASGDYEFTDLPAGDYTVTPSLAGQTFSPADYDIAISSADATGRDFALVAYEISGQVTNDEGPMEGVEVDLTGDITDTVDTDAAGNYSFTVLNGTYTVTPVSAPLVFDPVSSQVSVSFSDETTVDFYTATTIWYVDINAPGAQDGTSWITAYRHPQTAMDAASAGDLILVAAGFYYPLDTTGPVPTLALKDGVGVFGGYSGAAVGSGEIADRVKYIYEVDGDNKTALLGGDFTGDIFHVVTGASNAVIEGFYIQTSDATGYTGDIADQSGGGMYNSSVTGLQVRNCVFYDNYAGQGAAMMNTASSVAVENCWFLNNAAKAPSVVPSGGAIHSVNSTVNIVNGIFYQNWAGDVEGGGLGGAIASYASSVSVINCSFYDNECSDGQGESLYDDSSSTTTVVNSIVWDRAGTVEDGPLVSFAGAGSTITYSDVQDSVAGTPAGAGNMSVDPLFDAPTSYEYHLDALSLCMNAGTTAGAPNIDIAGSPRPDGVSNSVDMGAFEEAP
jgi:hypothetical protein